MNLVTETSKLLRICFVDGAQIGEINLKGSTGTYLHRFRLFGGYSNNPKMKDIHILNQGTDYIGFGQKKYLETIQKGLSRAFGKEVKFEKKTPRVKINYSKK
jgi:alanine-alpha-ketoisovalerate/valine-pyruvate aminotransferase